MFAFNSASLCGDKNKWLYIWITCIIANFQTDVLNSYGEKLTEYQRDSSETQRSLFLQGRVCSADCLRDVVKKILRYKGLSLVFPISLPEGFPQR